jgi:predicted ATPase/class 3 adenylate cyclase
MTYLFTSTLTYLFTDIEGSTRLWEDHPEPMRLAHARHGEIIAGCVGRRGGTLVRSRGEGDSTFSVFADAAAAVCAACDIQRALHHETWPQETPVRVRAALHTGPSDRLWGDYNSADVNRCARLRALANGGQVLVSQRTMELASGGLEEGMDFRALGTHRLKDLHRPEHVHQLLHRDLSADFPPLRSLDTLPTNLPEQLTSFIGREQELKQAGQLLGETRLLTLTGSGGAGKTRLALQLAADVLDNFRDGVYLVELAPLTDPERLSQTVCAALGVRDEPGTALETLLGDYLRTRQILLLLDNCEHLIDAAARFAESALRTAPRLQILATSREPLGILGETALRVPSLRVPDLPETPRVEEMMASEAVRLFVERVRAVRPGFALFAHNARAAAQVCRRLDGIPLAIELAAARAKVLSIEQIAERLDDRFHLLTGGSRTALPRQQTLRALIDWSYDLLSEPERLLLRRLAVFPATWTLEVAEKVCSDSPEAEETPGARTDVPPPGDRIARSEVLDLVSELVDKSLVIPLEQESATPRYRMLETVRQYARERLMDSGELARMRDRHQAWYVAFARAAEAGMEGPDVGPWFDRIDAERADLRAAIEWRSTDEAGRSQALGIVAALSRFWGARGRQTEDRECIFQALRSAGDAARTPGLARAWATAGYLCYQSGDLVEPGRCYDEALAIFREVEDRRGISDVLNLQGLLAWRRRDYPAAGARFQESLEIRRALGSRRGVAAVLNNLALVANEQGNNPASRALHEESLALHREIGDQVSVAGSLNNLGVVARDEGDYDAARRRFEQAKQIYDSVRHEGGMGLARGNIGLLLLMQGRPDEAFRWMREGLNILHAFGRPSIVEQLPGLAAAWAARGDPGRAARLLGAAAALSCPADRLPSPFEQALHRRWREDIQGALGAEEFEQQQRLGAELTLEQAGRLAATTDPPPRGSETP